MTLPTISDLKATLAVGGGGILSIELSWTAANDERIVYYIYEREEGKRTLVDTVTNTDRYYIPTFNPFTKKTYEIVPFDPTTNQFGDGSNVAEVEMKLGFHRKRQ